jgi:L-amino acid N-acyltransferase YncA
MSEVTFVNIAEQHLPEVLRIYNHFVLNTTVSFDMTPRTLDQIRASVINENRRYPSFVIIEEGLIKGYVLIAQHKVKQAYDATGEVTIYLNPEYVGRGLGGLALTFIEAKARTLDFHVLVATICAENDSSKYLFGKHGYSQCAHFKQVGYKFNRRLDIVSYQKILN